MPVRASTGRCGRLYISVLSSLRSRGELLVKELRSLLEDRIWETLGIASAAKWFDMYRPRGWRLDHDEVPEVAALLRYVGESKMEDVAETIGVDLKTSRKAIRDAAQSGNFPILRTQDQKRSDVRDSLADQAEYLVAERDENTCRKDMTYSEQAVLAGLLMEIESARAKERQGVGGGRPPTDEALRAARKAEGKTCGAGAPQVSGGSTKERATQEVGKALGMSGASVRLLRICRKLSTSCI